jgi:hypothetical protein
MHVANDKDNGVSEAERRLSQFLVAPSKFMRLSQKPATENP